MNSPSIRLPFAKRVSAPKQSPESPEDPNDFEDPDVRLGKKSGFVKKLLLVTLLLILLLFVLMIGATYYLLGTESGFAWTTEKLHTLDERLTLSPTSGNLQEGIATDEVRWEDDNISVRAKGVDSKWSSGCLLKTAFCLERLDIDEVRIKILAKDNAEKKPASGPIQLPAVALPLRVEAESVRIERLLIENDRGGPPLEIRDIHLQAEASGKNITVDTLTASFKNYTLSVTGDFVLDGDYELKAKFGVSAKDVIDTHDFLLQGTLHNTLRNLKINAAVTGAAEFGINADVQPLEPKIPLRANLSWQKIGWPLDAIDLVNDSTRQDNENSETDPSDPNSGITQGDVATVTSSEGRLMLVGSLDDYVMRFSTQIDGKQVPTTEVMLDGKINSRRAIIPQIDLLLLDGLATGSVAANWDNGVNWISELIFKEINPGREWKDMDGDLDGLVKTAGSAGDGKWAMNISTGKVDGTLRQFPFKLDAVASHSTDDVWHIEKLTLDNGPNILVAKGEAGKELDLGIVLDFPALQTLLPGMAGDIKGEVQVNGEIGKPSIQTKASSKLVKVGDILFRQMSVDANVNAAGLENSQVALKVGTLNASTQEITNVSANLDGTRNKHNVKLSGNGPRKTSVKLGGTGSLSDSFDWDGVLRSISANVPSHTLTLAKPTAVKWNHGRKRVLIDPHCWNSAGASLCLEDRISSDKTGNARVTLKNYSLQQLNNLLPPQAKFAGSFKANSKLVWDLNKEDGFSADLDAGISNGSLSISGPDAERNLKFDFQALTLKGKADPYTIVSDINLKSERMGNGTVALTLNPKNKDKPILGNVDLAGFDIGFLQAFLPDFEQVSGKVNAKGEIKGTLTDPDFDGRVSLIEPVFVSDDLPLSVDGGQINADVANRSATLSGRIDSGEGNIKIGGTAGWSKGSWKADISVNGEKLAIRQKPVIYSEVYPALRIGLQPGSVLVSGRVTIPTAEINIKERATGAATLSDDVIIIEEEIAKAEEEAENPSTGKTKVSTKVDVFLGNDVNLTGYGLNAKLTGEINVLKEDRDPTQLGGEIRVVEGFYKSYGQDLSIKDGQILFVGPIEQTTLNIDAVRAIDNEDRVAGLHLEGPIADPSVTLFTDPADKSQESILSYIVLGRDLGNSNSQGENNLLAQAALALTLRQGRGVATGFAESLGISDFTIDASGSGDDTQVVVSGRLSRKLLLRYGRSVFVPQETLFLRYDISKRLYLEAAQGVERAVDLFYSFSF